MAASLWDGKEYVHFVRVPLRRIVGPCGGRHASLLCEDGRRREERGRGSSEGHDTI